MARRRKDQSIIGVAMESAWQVAAALCGACLLGALVIVPVVAGSNQLLRALVPAGRLVLFALAAVFGVIAVTRWLARDKSVGTPAPAVQGQQGARGGGEKVVNIRHEEFVPPIRTTPYVPPKPTTWSLELLQSLDWKRFEEVVAAYFRENNFRSETIACGPDGGVDVRLFFADQTSPVGVVQCKAWGKRQVGVAPVRELLGVMAHENVKRGYFAATGDYTDEAIRFAAANPVKLISGADFLIAIARMDADRSARLLAVSTAGDYTTPSCPSCGEKLYLKTFRNGGAAWVCRGFPKCRTRIRTKAP